MTAPHRNHGRKATELRKSCLDKRRFSDELTARAFCQLECERGGKSKPAMGVYPCETCRGWHVTNNPKSRKYTVTATEMFCDPFADLAEQN